MKSRVLKHHNFKVKKTIIDKVFEKSTPKERREMIRDFEGWNKINAFLGFQLTFIVQHLNDKNKKLTKKKRR